MKRTKFKNKKHIEKGAVLADAKKQIVEQRQSNESLQEIKQWYDKTYNKETKIDFIRPNEMTKGALNKYFYFPTFKDSWYMPKTWAAVYAVHCSKADFIEENKSYRISQKNTAKLAGVSVPTVIEAEKQLLKSNYNYRVDGETISTTPFFKT